MASGKRAGDRQQATISPRLLVLAGAMTAAVVAWGYLVKAAIDFGTSARDGQSEGWWFLMLAACGAIACLFIGLILVARITRLLGITQAPGQRPERDRNTSSGGHRSGH